MSKPNESCDLVIQPDGCVRMIYSELVVPQSLGSVNIQRGSHVEPDEHGFWYADLEPCDGPILGPFDLRSDAIDAEVEWLTTNWLKV
jgi:hypothetical protein